MSDDTETDYTQVAEPVIPRSEEELAHLKTRQLILRDYIENRDKHPLPIRRVLRDLFEDW